jgi:hypothetical protein
MKTRNFIFSELLDEVQEYITRGKRDNYQYLLVMLDSFSYEYYPIFFISLEDLILKKQEYEDNSHMQRVMAVFDLVDDKELVGV